MFERYLTALRVVLSVALCTSAALFAYKSIGWQVMWDTSIMHYVNFLMDHGMVPYRDIIDINLPGCYFIENWAMHLFGTGDLGWRLYDFSVLAVTITAMIVISWPYDWFAGLFAGVVFVLLHAQGGPILVAERDEVMSALIIVGYALLFTAMRRQIAWLMFPFGLAIGLAASLKPTAAPFGLVLLAMVAFALRKRHVSLKLYLGYALIGMFLVFLINVEFLYKYHVFGDFFAISKRLTFYYTSIGNNPLKEMMAGLLWKRFYVPLAFGIALSFFNHKTKDWENWERFALVFGVVFGVASYFAQKKAISYHLYPFQGFVFIWSGLEMVKALKTKSWAHGLGLAGILLCMVYIVLPTTRRVMTMDPLNAQPDAMKGDLLRLGGTSLQHQVQCFDMVSSCFGSLRRLGLLPRTGFVGDYMFFQPRGDAPMAYYRKMLWDDLHRDPAKVIILTDQWFAEANSFAKLDQWPEMAVYLNSAYRLDATRTFKDSAYRVYVLKEGQSQDKVVQ